MTIRTNNYKKKSLKNKFYISPVIIPNENNSPEGNRHFGWPVATKLSNEIIVAYNRQKFHGKDDPTLSFRVPETNLSTSTAMVVHSKDEGKTWSEPVNLGDLVESSNPIQAVNDMRSIGYHNGKVFYLCNLGLFEYDGNRWNHLKNAYELDNLKVFPNQAIPAKAPLGPKIISIANQMCVFHSRLKNPPDSQTPKFYMGVSEDNGQSWEQRIWTLPNYEVFQPVEPCACVYQGRIVLLNRADGLESMRDELTIFVAKQEGVPTGISFPFWQKRTNLKLPTEFKEKLKGHFRDTSDIIFNPVTNKFEVILSNRASGYDLEFELKEQMTLSLWSISPENLLTSNPHAEFKFEGNLLARRHRKGVGAPRGYDGFHSGGTILTGDKQKIFIYSGYNKTGPRISPGAGIFQLVRPLKHFFPN